MLFLLGQKKDMTRKQWEATIYGIHSPAQNFRERLILERLFLDLPDLDQMFMRSVARPPRKEDYSLLTP